MADKIINLQVLVENQPNVELRRRLLTAAPPIRLGVRFFDAVGGEAPASFSSIEGVRGIFASDGGTTIGWIHYLAFDMFAGLWIARDADAKGFSRLLQAPILFATFMAGPLGLFLWLVIRERRARAAGRWE